MRQRAVITGFGVLAANGIGTDAFWESLLAGRSGVKRISLFDAADHPVNIAGEISGFSADDYIPHDLKPQRMGRHAQLCVAAAKMAVAGAGLREDELRHLEPVPAFIGVSSSAFDVIERSHERLSKLGPKKASPFAVSASQPHAVASVVGEVLKLRLQPITISSACAAGLQAVAAAADQVTSGRSPVAFASGADAPITHHALAIMAASRMIEPFHGDPARASRPFDRDRNGGILAEGAGFVVLESLDHALDRGATIWAEILGHASANDPRGGRGGDGLRDTIRMALANARCIASDIDYVCAHGPSDKELDVAETEAIKQALGEHAYRIPVSSIKGCTGNPLSSAGPIQIAAASLALRDNLVPPTANHEHPDPRCDLDYVPGCARRVALRRVLVNVHGMGGGNTSVILERFGGP